MGWAGKGRVYEAGNAEGHMMQHSHACRHPGLLRACEGTAVPGPHTMHQGPRGSCDLSGLT